MTQTRLTYFRIGNKSYIQTVAISLADNLKCRLYNLSTVQQLDSPEI